MTIPLYLNRLKYKRFAQQKLILLFVYEVLTVIYWIFKSKIVYDENYDKISDNTIKTYNNEILKCVVYIYLFLLVLNLIKLRDIQFRVAQSIQEEVWQAKTCFLLIKQLKDYCKCFMSNIPEPEHYIVRTINTNTGHEINRHEETDCCNVYCYLVFGIIILGYRTIFTIIVFIIYNFTYQLFKVQYFEEYLTRYYNSDDKFENPQYFIEQRQLHLQVTDSIAQELFLFLPFQIYFLHIYSYMVSDNEYLTISYSVIMSVLFLILTFWIFDGYKLNDPTKFDEKQAYLHEEFENSENV